MSPLRTTSYLLLLACAASASAAADAAADRLKLSETTVLDMKTGLTWQRTAPKETYAYLDAGRYCAALELDGEGWRLPTIKELHTLVDESRSLPALDATVFPDGRDWTFWSSSPLTSFAGTYAWALSFTYGFDAWFTLETPQKVRCVR